MAEGARYASKRDWRKAAKTYRAAIALKPDEALAYFNLGGALSNSGHRVDSSRAVPRGGSSKTRRSVATLSRRRLGLNRG